jgi:hypothetical protein
MGWGRLEVPMSVARAIILSAFGLSFCRLGEGAALQTDVPRALERAARVPQGPVEAEMRHVLYHVDDRVVLQIEHLRGALLPKGEAPPWFDDPESFTIAIDTGTVRISPAESSALLNDFVFNYDRTPLKRLR